MSVRLREVDTVEYQRDRGLGVTVYFGKRKGAASTADLGPAAVRETVAKACAIARYTAEDPYAGLVEPEALARDIPDLDLDHPWELTPERAIELARECEAAGLAVDPRVSNSEGAAVSSQRHSGVYGNSLGFLGGYSSTSHSLSCALLAQQDEDMQRDYWYSIARDASELGDAALIGRTAGQRALARLGARRLATRKAPVAFTPDVARGLFRHFIGAISGTSQYRKSSFLLNAAGEQVFPDFLDMQERPHILKGLASAPFDQEGAATHERELVSAGVLERLRARQLFRAAPRAQDHRQRRRRPQSHRHEPPRRARARGVPRAPAHRAAGDRADGAGRERGDRRLLARRERLLGGERRRSPTRCTRSPSPATSSRCTATSSRWATISTCAAASVPRRC